MIRIILLLTFILIPTVVSADKKVNAYSDERFIIITLYGFTHLGDSGYQLLTVHKDQIPVFEGYLEFKPSLGISGSLFLIEEKKFELSARLYFEDDADASLKSSKNIDRKNGRFIQLSHQDGKLIIAQQETPYIYL